MNVRLLIIVSYINSKTEKIIKENSFDYKNESFGYIAITDKSKDYFRYILKDPFALFIEYYKDNNLLKSEYKNWLLEYA